MTDRLLAFTGFSVLLAVTPGPDFALISGRDCGGARTIERAVRRCTAGRGRVPGLPRSARALGEPPGLLSASLNPKLGAFFVSVLPQFIDPTRAALPQSLLLGAIFIVVGVAWMNVHGLSVTKLRDLLMSTLVRRWLERLTGIPLLGFSAKLALDAR